MRNARKICARRQKQSYLATFFVCGRLRPLHRTNLSISALHLAPFLIRVIVINCQRYFKSKHVPLAASILSSSGSNIESSRCHSRQRREGRWAPIPKSVFLMTIHRSAQFFHDSWSPWDFLPASSLTPCRSFKKSKRPNQCLSYWTWHWGKAMPLTS